jgi:hypothetical protein
VSAAALNLPLSFEENVGQIQGPQAAEVRYVSRGSAYTIFLTPKEAVLEVGRPTPGAGISRAAVLRLRLSGARELSPYIGLDKLPGTSNYFIGNDPAQWHAGVATYARVAAQDVYPGIDLEYHGNQGQLEYDFEVAPGANPRKIRLSLEGAQGLRLDSQGDLLVQVEGGELRFRRPVAYQSVEGVRRLVPVGYALKGKNRVEFRLASYDERERLVIDPILSYSTYVGGSSIDGANAIAVAPDNTAFIAGGTFSTNFPVVNPLQANAGGPADFPQDAFVSKISADGSSLLYSTYLGGKNQDVASGIAVDTAGEAFVVGTTLSPNFPVTAGSFDTLCGGDGQCGATWNPDGYIVSNAFVTKLNKLGTGLIYSGFLGYYENVEGLAIAVDNEQNAYVTGQTGANITPTVPIVSPNVPPPPFPTTNGYQTTFGGGATDAFVTKIDAQGTGFLYSTYLGGTDDDSGYGIAVSAAGVAYVTGLTYSTAFPTIGTPIQGTYSVAGDAFVSAVNTTLTGAGSLIYSTYLGGTGLDQGNAIALDTSNNLYVTGLTTSRAASLGFTPPLGAFQTDCDQLTTPGTLCEGDAFVAKFNVGVTPPTLTYFTYLGGALADSGAGIAFDTSGDAFVTGSTVSTNFPIAPSPTAVFQPKYGGGNADAFVTEVNPTGTALVYSSYLGGSGTDAGMGIAVDALGNAYVTGQTCSQDFPLAAPLQATAGGNCDAFVSKVIPSGGVSLIPAGLIFTSQPVNTTSPALAVTLTNGGTSALTISSIAVSGLNSGDFTIVQTPTACGTSVPANGTCTITVTFSPLSITPPARTAQLSVTDSGPGSPQVVDLSGTAGLSPIVTLLPTDLTFATPQAVGATSSPLTLIVTNTGTAALNITSATVSGEFAIPSGGNTCTTPLQATKPNSNCTISVTFTPTIAGASVGSLTLVDNAPDSPQIVLLTGTGAAQPAVSLSATSLSFGSQAINVPSAAQTVTLTNTGTAPLTLGTITSSGPFSATNTCTGSVAPQGSCLISVTFTPTVAGAASGSISIADNAPNSPQTIALTGGGADFSIALNPTSATVVAGNKASITVSVSAISGFSSAVSFACTGLPSLATCSASPSTVTPSGTSAATTTLTISTTQRTSTPPLRWPRLPGAGTRTGIWLLWGFLLLLLAAWGARWNRLRWSGVTLAVLALCLAGFAACGQSGTGYVDPTGTPAGTYTVTVTATSSGLSHLANITLTVQ